MRFIITIVLAGIWGYNCPYMFPNHWLAASIIGGVIIGFASFIFQDYIDD